MIRERTERPRLRKREIALAVGAGLIAATGAAAVLTDGFGGPGSMLRRDEVIEVREADERTYQLADFDRITTSGPQDIEIAFGEEYSVRAEGRIARLDVVVEDGELIIRARDGDFGALGSTRLFITVPRLTGVTLNGSGEVTVDGIKGDRFAALIQGGFGGNLAIDGLEVDEAEFTINGAGDITAEGVARATRVTINGVGDVQAGGLQSRIAAVNVRGPGDVELSVEQEAVVSVSGPGEVDISGPARCTVSTSGPGSVNCGDG